MENVKFIVKLTHYNRSWDFATFEFDSLTLAECFANTILSHQRKTDQDRLKIVIAMDKIELTNGNESEVKS